jgi:hypothetical protein
MPRERSNAEAAGCTVTVDVRFAVDAASRPPDGPIHDALRGVRSLEIEAPTSEVGVLYAALLVDALEQAGN